MTPTEALNYLLSQAAKAPTTIERAGPDRLLLDACARVLVDCVNKAATATKAGREPQ